MRIQIGETRTASIPINIEYRCSSCRELNQSLELIEVSHFTPAFWGITLGDERSRSQEAGEKLKKKVDKILDEKNPHRFSKAAFDCKCEFCGHREPWARMNYSDLAKCTNISAVILFFSLFILSYLFSDIYNGAAILFFSIVFAFPASVLAGSFIYRAINNKKMMKLIATLPSDSLPTLVIPAYERYFGTVEREEARIRKERAMGGITDIEVISALPLEGNYYTSAERRALRKYKRKIEKLSSMEDSPKRRKLDRQICNMKRNGNIRSILSAYGDLVKMALAEKRIISEKKPIDGLAYESQEVQEKAKAFSANPLLLHNDEYYEKLWKISKNEFWNQVKLEWRTKNPGKTQTLTGLPFEKRCDYLTAVSIKSTCSISKMRKELRSTKEENVDAMSVFDVIDLHVHYFQRVI